LTEEFVELCANHIIFKYFPYEAQKQGDISTAALNIDKITVPVVFSPSQDKKTTTRTQP
jgi:hypothetical protein